VIFATFFATAGLLAGVGYVQENRARAFSTSAVRDIYTTWNVEALRRIASSNLLKTLKNTGENTDIFALGKQKMGTVDRIDAPMGGIGLHWGPRARNRGFLGRYEFQAHSSSGDLVLTVDLVWEGGRWRLDGTQFNWAMSPSDALKN